jgi:hypothetical protein
MLELKGKKPDLQTLEEQKVNPATRVAFAFPGPRRRDFRFATTSIILYPRIIFYLSI